MTSLPSFPGGKPGERIPGGSASRLWQVRQSLTVVIPWLSQGTRKSQEVV